jgi:hypothetical protein
MISIKEKDSELLTHLEKRDSGTSNKNIFIDSLTKQNGIAIYLFLIIAYEGFHKIHCTCTLLLDLYHFMFCFSLKEIIRMFRTDMV